MSGIMQFVLLRLAHLTEQCPPYVAGVRMSLLIRLNHILSFSFMLLGRQTVIPGRCENSRPGENPARGADIVSWKLWPRRGERRAVGLPNLKASVRRGPGKTPLMC